MDNDLNIQVVPVELENGNVVRVEATVLNASGDLCFTHNSHKL